MTDLKNRVAAKRNGGGQQQAPAGNGGPGRELTPAERKLQEKMGDARSMFAKMKGEFATALPRHVGVDRFMRMALTCMRKNPALLDCDPPSVLAALLEAARLGLEPGTKQAAIVPFGRQATFIAQWQGLVELMYRSGQVASVTAEFIHEGDDWEYTIGDGARFWHRPNLLATDRGPIVLAYAFATIRGGSRSKVVFLNKAEAEQVRDRYSKNYQRAERNRRENAQQFANNPEWGKFNSTWHTEFDAMWRKSCVRRLADWVPQSPELRELLTRENEAGEMHDAAQVVVPEEVFDAEVVEDNADDQPAATEPPRAGEFAQARDAAMAAADAEAAGQAADDDPLKYSDEEIAEGGGTRA